MGCPVNGIGEAKDADIGITGSGRKDEYIIFEKGKQVGPAYQLNEALSLIKEKIEQF
jgi:4-hydroxy-3-methylbut-2-en-1-yl diphosphate synthase IspG/GcpE